MTGRDPDAAQPGFCSDHPTLELVTHRRAGVRWWYDRPRTDLPVVCPSGEHEPHLRDRCLWCGRSLLEGPPPRSRGLSPLRGYCRRRGDMCRIEAHRARRRGLVAPAAIA